MSTDIDFKYKSAGQLKRERLEEWKKEKNADKHRRMVEDVVCRISGKQTPFEKELMDAVFKL